MWQDIKNSLAGWFITIVAVLWIFWYTGHIHLTCNQAGCIGVMN